MNRTKITALATITATTATIFYLLKAGKPQNTTAQEAPQNDGNEEPLDFTVADSFPRPDNIQVPVLPLPMQDNLVVAKPKPAPVEPKPVPVELKPVPVEPKPLPVDSGVITVKPKPVDLVSHVLPTDPVVKPVRLPSEGFVVEHRLPVYGSGGSGGSGIVSDLSLVDRFENEYLDDRYDDMRDAGVYTGANRYLQS